MSLANPVPVDATVVRMVLVPAVMQLLGPANWWLPRWIGRAIPSLAVEPNLDHLAVGGLVGTWPVSAEVAERSRRFRLEAPQQQSHDQGPTNGAIKVPNRPNQTTRT